MPLLVVVFLFCLAVSSCADSSMLNFAVYVPYAESVYTRLGPLTSLAAMGHKIDPSDDTCTKFCGLYLNDTMNEKFPEDGYEMTVMLFKFNTKSVDLPVRFSELVYFLVEMVGVDEFSLLYGLEIFRTDKNMACRVHAAESVIDRLYKQIRIHPYYAESFNGATMMIADKKPISITLIPKTGRDLWNLDVDYGQGYKRFCINSKATTSPSLNCLMAFPEFPFDGVRLYHKFTENLSSELPQLIYTVPFKYIKAFIDSPIQQRMHHGELYEINMNFGLGHVVGIEIFRSETQNRVNIKYFLDISVTEKDVKQIDYFLRRLPIFDSFVNREYDFKCPFVHAVMRTSVTGPTMHLFPTKGEAFMVPSQYYEQGKLPKKIEDATFIFEFKGRDLASSKKAYGLVYTGPNDSFAKTAVLHSTYYNFLTKHHLVQDLLYRIVLRPADNGKSMQYIWIMSTLPGKERADIMTIVLKEMMLFLWMSLGGKPQHVEMLTIHPTTLKVLKGEVFRLFSPETIDLYMKNPIEEIETMALNMPFANKFAQFTVVEQPSLPKEGNSEGLPKCSYSGEEAVIQPEPIIEVPKDQTNNEILTTPSDTAPLIDPLPVVKEVCMPSICQLPLTSSFLMNSEFEASRLVVLITGLPRQTSSTLAEVESLLKSCNFAEFIGKVTVNSAGSIEITLCDSLSFIQLTQLKSLLSSLFKGMVAVRNRVHRS